MGLLGLYPSTNSNCLMNASIFIKFIIVVFLFSGCNSSSDDLFVGKWEAIEYTINEADQLYFNQITMTFNRDGSFFQQIITDQLVREDDGLWEFDKNEKTFKMSYDRNDQVVTWNIMEQKDDTFKMNNQEYRGFYVEWKFKRIE